MSQAADQPISLYRLGEKAGLTAGVVGAMAGGGASGGPVAIIDETGREGGGELSDGSVTIIATRKMAGSKMR